MLLHLCSIVEGSLLRVACYARPRLTASFKSVVAVLMVVLLLYEYLKGFIYLVLRIYLVHGLHLATNTFASTLKSMQCRGLVYLLAPLSAMQSYEDHGSIISFYQASRWFRPSHTIKSVVFLLDVLDGVCGKRYIKSASIEQYCRGIA